MANVRVSSRQSLLDVAIQKSGSIVTVFRFADRNNLSITDNLTPGQVLDLVDVNNVDVVAYYKSKNLVPATALTADNELIAGEPDGISYWAIDVDFIIQ